MQIVEKGNDPFPFLILDNVVSEELLRAVNADWPDTRWPWWHVYGDQNSQKLASKDPSRLPQSALKVIDRLAELPVCSLLNLSGLFPDYSLHGAGLHELKPGGYLKAHLDSEVHPTMGWSRELSGVLFCNETWNPEWGGTLQFLDSDSKEVVKCIEVKFNRLILFQCQGKAWHQVSPLDGLTPNSRKTLAMFWWKVPPTKLMGANAAQFLA